MAMKDMIIPAKPTTTYIREITNPDPIVVCLRTYPSAVGRLMLQIRNYGPANERRTGKHRNMIAGTELTVEMACALKAQLEQFIEEEQR